jgi:hypothetical protein
MPKKQRKRPNTKNRGAADLRDSLLDYLKRELGRITINHRGSNETVWFNTGKVTALRMVAGWVRKSAKRANRRKGGLGRK